ncbi:hypothetical protein ABG067_008332, partial [Albugo candida]
MRLGEELYMKLERMTDPGRTTVGKAEDHWASNYVFQVNYNNVLSKIRSSIMSPMNVIRIMKGEEPIGGDAGATSTSGEGVDAVAAGIVSDDEAVVGGAGEGESGEGDQPEVEYVGGNPEDFQDGETVGYNTWDEESDEEEVNNSVLGKRRRSLSTSSEDCDEGSDRGESDEESEVEEGQSSSFFSSSLQHIAQVEKNI